MRDDSRWSGAYAGATIRVLGGRRAALALTADLALASVRADSRGLESGNVLHTGKTMWGGLVGVEATCAPIPRVPLALELGAAIGVLTPVINEHIVDGYSPLDSGFGFSQFRLGIAWR